MEEELQDEFAPQETQEGPGTELEEQPRSSGGCRPRGRF